MSDRVPVGVALGSSVPPSRLLPLGRQCEELGFGEIWLTEDYFYTAAVAGAAGILGATERVPVGFGILSGLVRHPAVLAMEIATLAHMHPGRVLPGIGLGLPMWLEQMRLKPRSQLGAMREVVDTVRALLAGERVTRDGLFGLVDVQLEYPAPDVPLLCGVIGPRTLTLAGEIADGVIGSVMAGEVYLREATERIAAGGETPEGFRALVLFACDRDGAPCARVRARLVRLLPDDDRAQPPRGGPSRPRRDPGAGGAGRRGHGRRDGPVVDGGSRRCRHARRVRRQDRRAAGGRGDHGVAVPGLAARRAGAVRAGGARGAAAARGLGRRSAVATTTRAPANRGLVRPSSAVAGGYSMNSISEYFGTGHRSSATMRSSLSATTRHSFMAANTTSRM